MKLGITTSQAVKRLRNFGRELRKNSITIDPKFYQKPIKKKKINHRMHAAEAMALGGMIGLLFASYGLPEGQAFAFVMPGAFYYAWALLQ